MQDGFKNHKTNWLIPIGIILIVIAIVLMIWFFLHGQTTTTGGSLEVTKDSSITCSISGQEYPFFRQNDANKRETKVIALFSGSNFKSISLFYTLHFSDSTLVKGSEAQNHASMNIHYGEDGLSADALSATYSMQNDKLSFSIYAEASEFNTTTSKYFLASGYSKNVKFDTLLQNYAKQGFNCVVSE